VADEQPLFVIIDGLCSCESGCMEGYAACSRPHVTRATSTLRRWSNIDAATTRSDAHEVPVLWQRDCGVSAGRGMGGWLFERTTIRMVLDAALFSATASLPSATVINRERLTRHVNGLGGSVCLMTSPGYFTRTS
jgi:hypothetical protein